MSSYTKIIWADNMHCLLREVAAINRCQSYSGIVQLLGVKRRDDKYLLTTQLAGKELGKDILYYSESQILDYITQILQAVAYCHSLNIYHRDIKPNNIVVSNGKVTLIDFGISRHDVDDCVKEEIIITGPISSHYYSNPECLSGNTTFYRKGDEWSIGIVLYNMLTHSQLIESINPLDEIKAKLSKGLQLERYTTSKVLIQLCEGLLRLDPAERLSCEDALRILSAEVPVGNYTLTNHILPYPHTHIEETHYNIIRDWLVEVKSDFQLNSATLSNTLQLIQVYTSHNIIDLNRYQLLGVVCLYLSACLFDIYPPYVEYLVYVTDNKYRTDQFYELMEEILVYFKYDVDRM